MVKDRVPGHTDAVLGKQLVDACAVEEDVLPQHVVEADGVAQAHVRLGLCEREAGRGVADEKVDDGPLLDRLLEQAALAKGHDAQVVEAPQPRQDGAHRPAVQLGVCAAHA